MYTTCLEKIDICEMECFALKMEMSTIDNQLNGMMSTETKETITSACSGYTLT